MKVIKCWTGLGTKFSFGNDSQRKTDEIITPVEGVFKGRCNSSDAQQISNKMNSMSQLCISDGKNYSCTKVNKHLTVSMTSKAVHQIQT